MFTVHNVYFKIILFDIFDGIRLYASRQKLRLFNTAQVRLEACSVFQSGGNFNFQLTITAKIHMTYEVSEC